MKVLKLLSGIILIVLTSCLDDPNCINGNGDYISRAFSVSDFDQISLFVAADVDVTQSSSTSMEVEGQENILDALDVQTNNGKLVIGRDNCFKNMKKIKVHLSTPSLSLVQITGSGNISGIGTFSGSDFIADISGSGNIAFDLDVQKLNSHITGSGDMTFTGKATDHTMGISGSGYMRCFQLEGETADVTITGSGNSEVTVSDQLKVHIEGSGNVYYKGNPVLDSNISGSGKVINKN